MIGCCVAGCNTTKLVQNSTFPSLHRDQYQLVSLGVSSGTTIIMSLRPPAGLSTMYYVAVSQLLETQVICFNACRTAQKLVDAILLSKLWSI